MKKHLILTTLAFILVAPTLAWSQSAPPAGSPPADGTPPPDAAMQGGHEQKFEEMKARVLQHISEHLAETQKRQSCVEAAQNREALRACMPQHGQGGPGGHWGNPPAGGESGDSHP